jgi:hypothetical protein
MATMYIDKLGEQRFVEEGGRIREVTTRRDVTDWWTASQDGAPVEFGEAVKRLAFDEDIPVPGTRLLDAGGLDIDPARPLYLIDRTFTFRDTNKAFLDLRWEYLGSSADSWHDVDGALHQLQTGFDKTGAPIVIQRKGGGFPQGVEVPTSDPRRRAMKTYGRFLGPNETVDSLVNDYIGKVNKTEYRGGEPGTWLVTNMQVQTMVEIVGAQRPLVQIKVEIEYNRFGHRLFVYWRDPISNRIGVNIAEDDGYKRVDWFEEIEFDQEFGP